MQAYEFLATPKNGVITIPEELRNRITSNVKVIVLEMKTKGVRFEEVNKEYKSDLLLRPTLDTNGWKFSREEANER